ncbi:uncharacterized protein LOC115293386 [Suricata suricatta]|uniref:uncharacterized protein LOC115293386 n=1 Tax=Suricata suricatta TaxID=37032 RepID=UPI0011557298|nr:uncharacterized protein LOC115293386 [Suricata suricatta]
MSAPSLCKVGESAGGGAGSCVWTGAPSFRKAPRLDPLSGEKKDSSRGSEPWKPAAAGIQTLRSLGRPPTPFTPRLAARAHDPRAFPVSCRRHPRCRVTRLAVLQSRSRLRPPVLVSCGLRSPLGCSSGERRPGSAATARVPGRRRDSRCTEGGWRGVVRRRRRGSCVSEQAVLQPRVPAQTPGVRRDCSHSLWRLRSCLEQETALRGGSERAQTKKWLQTCEQRHIPELWTADPLRGKAQLDVDTCLVLLDILLPGEAGLAPSPAGCWVAQAGHTACRERPGAVAEALRGSWDCLPAPWLLSSCALGAHVLPSTASSALLWQDSQRRVWWWPWATCTSHSGQRLGGQNTDFTKTPDRGSMSWNPQAQASVTTREPHLLPSWVGFPAKAQIICRSLPESTTYSGSHQPLDQTKPARSSLQSQSSREGSRQGPRLLV